MSILEITLLAIAHGGASVPVRQRAITWHPRVGLPRGWESAACPANGPLRNVRVRAHPAVARQQACACGGSAGRRPAARGMHA